MKSISMNELLSLSITRLLRKVRVAMLSRRVAYYKQARAESIEAQVQERERQRNIESMLAEASADLQLMERR